MCRLVQHCRNRSQASQLQSPHPAIFLAQLPAVELSANGSHRRCHSTSLVAWLAVKTKAWEAARRCRCIAVPAAVHGDELPAGSVHAAIA